MNMYFIPGLSDDEKSRLRAASISFHDFTIAEELGLILEDSLLQAVLTILPAKVVAQAQSTYAGIVRLLLDTRNLPAAAEKETAGGVAGTWFGKNQEGMSQLAVQILVPQLQRDIVLSNPCKAVVPIEDGRFHIHICSSAKKSRCGVTVPESLWGIAVDCKGSAWPASGRGLAIKNNAGKYAVAEVVGDNNLYIHHDLAKTGSVNELLIFAQVLRRAVLLLAPQHKPKQQKTLFVEECCKCVTRTVLSFGMQGVVDHDAELRRLNKELTQQLRAARAAEMKILRNEAFSLDSFGAEYDNLRQVPKIKNVVVEDGKIIVFTDVIYARGYQNQYHEIGAFKIVLDPATSAPGWFNQTRLINGYAKSMNAPHVWESGAACLGNAATSFVQLFAARQWSLAAALAIEFVENVNLDDTAGVRVGSWPKANTAVALAPCSASTIVRDSDYIGNRQKYMKACEARIGEIVIAARQDVVDQRRVIERHQAEIVRHTRAREIMRRRQAGGKLCDKQEFAAELDRLLQLPKVASVNVEPGVICVVTDMLDAVDARTHQIHTLGKFKICIQLDGQCDSLRWFNLTRQIHGCLPGQQAPQVLNSGRACISEIKESFPDLIASMQFSIVAQLAIDFIEQVNVDEPSGEHLTKWPLAT